jgi:hypothetical protein
MSRAHQCNGDKSPAESGENSPHSKAWWWREGRVRRMPACTFEKQFDHGLTPMDTDEEIQDANRLHPRNLRQNPCPSVSIRG